MAVDLQEILKNKKERIYEKEGIYFLIKNNEVVFIDFGRNLDLSFKEQRKDYDSYFILEYPKETRPKQELIMLMENIQKHRPKYNLMFQTQYQIDGWALHMKEQNNIDTFYLKCMHFINGKEVD